MVPSRPSLVYLNWLKKEGILTEIYNLLNRGFLPVKIIAEEGLPVMLSTMGFLQLLRALADIRGDLGYGNMERDDSMRALLNAIVDTVGTDKNGETQLINVNLADSNIGLADLARVGSKSGG